MLSLNQVSLRRGPRLLFSGATFQVHAGQRLGLIGANGSGKSSLFSLLLGELEADMGELGLNSSDVLAHVRQESPEHTCTALDYVLDGDPELRMIQARIATLSERVAGADVDHELHDLYERLENIDGYSAEARAGRLLHGLGFAPESFDNPVRSFSGGWRMRLNLAQALMCRSDILLLDEPTNHLDLPAILWLERRLVAYQGILLVISHDRDFLDAVCTRIAHIERETIRLYSGNYSEFEVLRAEQLSQQQAMHEKQQREIQHLQSFIDRFRYKATKARQAQSRIKMMERMTIIAPAHVDSAFHFEFLEPPRQPQHLLKLEHAELGYPERGVVLSDVTLNLRAGDRLGLLGVNGAGKSTLVKALASGTTLLKGERNVSRDTRIGYFAQHQLELLDLQASPAAHLQDLFPQMRESEIRNWLGRFGFAGARVFEPVAPFSGGEKARLVLALLIRQQPNLLLLDEPTNHLDLEMRQALSMALMEYSGALLVISHDRHLLRSVCDELLIVHDGLVDWFDRSLDEYPAWLREREARGGGTVPAEPVVKAQPKLEPALAATPAPAPTATPTSTPTPPPASTSTAKRKTQRQQDARQRERLKPLSDTVRKIEKQLSARRMELELLEQRLTEAGLYSEPERQPELLALVQEQGQVKAAITDLEWAWLEASEALEAAQKD